MRKIILALSTMMLLSATCWAQSADELKKQLQERDLEIDRLRQRLIEAQSPPFPEHDADRALERALVRQGGLLLGTNTFEVEPNFVYSHQSIAASDFRRDAFGPALAFRYGLPWSSQFNAQIPFVFENRHTAGGSSHARGVGDVQLGLSHQFVSERAYVPSLIGGINYSIGTGRNTQFSQTTAPVALGTGFDTVSADLTATKSLDPLVVFGGYSFGHAFAGKQGGARVDLGNSHALRLGTILASSPSTSLRTSFTATFFDKTRVNGTALAGTDEPSGVVELGGSLVLTERTLLDVSVGLGVTRSAPDFSIGVALPFRF